MQLHVAVSASYLTQLAGRCLGVLIASMSLTGIVAASTSCARAFISTQHKTRKCIVTQNSRYCVQVNTVRQAVFDIFKTLEQILHVHGQAIMDCATWYREHNKEKVTMQTTLLLSHATTLCMSFLGTQLL